MMKVVGLDLSLRGTGICILGPGLLKTFHCGLEIDRANKALNVPRELIERLITISNEIVQRCREFRVEAVGIENYAFGAFGGGNSSSATALGELAGIVKYRLVKEYHLVPKMYAPTSARKITFGKGNGKLKKKEVGAKLKSLGMIFPTHDEADAFVVAAACFCEQSGSTAPDFWQDRVWQG